MYAGRAALTPWHLREDARNPSSDCATSSSGVAAPGTWVAVRTRMAATVLDFTPVKAPDGELYYARACGRPRDDGTWEGWLEFETLDGGAAHRTPRETTQPNFTDLAYWATGLTGVYLEGALRRALERRVVVVEEPSEPAFDGPAEDADVVVVPAPAAVAADSVDAILDPFEVYARGEGALRAQLRALATWHIRNIARAYDIVPDPVTVETLGKTALIEAIVAAARTAASVGAGAAAR